MDDLEKIKADIEAHEAAEKQRRLEGKPPIRIVDYLTRLLPEGRDELTFDPESYERLRQMTIGLNVHTPMALSGGLKRGELLILGGSVNGGRSMVVEMMKQRAEKGEPWEIQFIDMDGWRADQTAQDEEKASDS